ncbi:beta-ketoacyl synthase N-terminal-like domain-containing protein [Actinomadura sp. DC4]|uniref:beta-ketoacyl synthase N-terminal-like domain-containing protein n=1 Tax=Actinomadura sp. DC4 TaxID=3055069 RepID=UPI0025AF41FB|nr:beta-ketoacyl synthase N-terminal-like domain-containing protein [Actinomadura sp. DC4]MDN3354266.1 beta-ketoacyl synthase N-terminal-like domain-containing protein [Actinomadura sp. DC4]
MGGREVVVTAAEVLTSVAEDLDGFSAALREGRSGVRATRDEAGPEARTPAAAWLGGFDVRGWAERRVDPATAGRLVRVTGRAALPGRTGACVSAAAVRGLSGADLDETGLVVAGNNLNLSYQAEAARRFEARPASLRPSHALTHLDTDVIGVVSEATGVRGEGWQAGAASASGTVAVVLASRMIAAGVLRRCLVVAPLCELSDAELRSFQASGAMAGSDSSDPARLCRPFDVSREGFVYGQGAAAVLLEDGDVAAARGAKPMARIAGHGQRLDGRRGTRPDPAGQVAALRTALDGAGVSPREVDYVNAHGTGSVVGDEAEAHALTEVFGARPLVNSTKPLIGHCMGAAGLLEIVATLLQMRDGFVHPNPNLDVPLDPAPTLAGRAAVPAVIGTAVSNSVAFSGINCAVVLRAPR